MNLQVVHADTRLSALEDFFREMKWGFQYMTQENTLRAGCRGRHGTWICFARVNENGTGLTLQIALGLCVSPFLHTLVQDYLARINCLLPHSIFTLDVHTGDIRLSSVLACFGNTNTDTVSDLVLENVGTVDRYFTGLMAVIYGGLSPDQALTLSIS